MPKVISRGGENTPNKVSKKMKLRTIIIIKAIVITLIGFIMMVESWPIEKKN